jgi:uncharacterized membrane protein YdjX (TVP38/TMEM64 family)
MSELIVTLDALVASEVLLALVLAGLTAAMVACCVPGTIIPLSVSSGALLGGWEGAGVVTGGALVGSMALFLASRHLLKDRIRARWGDRLARFEGHLAKRGFFYVVGLRIAGVPHFLVTAGSALGGVRARSFIAASLLGFLPVIALSSNAGSLF